MDLSNDPYSPRTVQYEKGSKYPAYGFQRPVGFLGRSEMDLHLGNRSKVKFFEFKLVYILTFDGFFAAFSRCFT